MSTDNDDFINATEEEVSELIKYIVSYWKAKREFDQDLEDIINEHSEEDPK